MGTEIADEPVRGSSFPPELLGLSGLEQLRALSTGQVQRPPIGHLTGMHPTEVGIGSVTFTMPITGWLHSPQGIAPTGVVAILADGPLGCAVQSVLPPGTGFTTAELSINMVRPVPDVGQLIARGRLIHVGRQLGLSETFVTDDAGRLIAHGTSRCVIFPPAEDAPPPPVVIAPAADDADGWVPPFRREPLGAVLDQDVWDARTGLQIMLGFISGELPRPPVSRLLGAVPVEATEGHCTFAMPATRWLSSPTGFVEGGVTACLADFAAAGAVQTTVPPGTSYAPTDLRVQFLRPLPTDGRTITAHAQVVHRGRNVAVTRAEVTIADGKLVALANASAVILPGRRANLSDTPEQA